MRYTTHTDIYTLTHTHTPIRAERETPAWRFEKMGLTSQETKSSEKKKTIVMANERTPLVATVRTAPPRQRYPHHTLRRFCTIALTCSLLALFTVFLFDLGFSGHHEHRGHHHHGHHPEWSWPDCKDRKVSYDELKEILLETPSSEKAEEWQRYYTAGAHLAGQNYSQVGGISLVSLYSKINIPVCYCAVGAQPAPLWACTCTSRQLLFTKNKKEGPAFTRQ